MSNVTAELIKQLRERTGVGMGKCKAALEETNGDIEKAIEHLRKTGIASAVKKESRDTNEGVILAKQNTKHVAVVEVNAETDFVVQNERFKAFENEIADELLSSIPASLEDFLQTKFSKNSSQTIDEYRREIVSVLGENINIARILMLEKGSDSSFGIYSHMNGKILSIVEIEGSSDLNDFAKDIAMHIAAEDPLFLVADEVPVELVAKEKEIAASQIKNKPPELIDKIVGGKLKAFYDQVCLVNQKYIKDPSLTISQLVEAKGKELGKSIKIARFVRWQIGGSN